MRSSDVLLQADWHSLSHCYKLVLLKLIHKAFHDELPQVLSDNIVMKRPTGYSLRASDSFTVPRFNSIYGKNSIADRGSVLWNILISNDKNFSSTSYKNRSAMRTWGLMLNFIPFGWNAVLKYQHLGVDLLQVKRYTSHYNF